MDRTERLPFKPRARLLLLLGDQLIRDPGMAVFELVKNAYDADSPDVSVTMTGLDTPELAKIVISDSGSGMTWNDVTNVWLEPGTDNKAEQRKNGERTKKYKRLPLGEKGVGRFAAHKLGNHIRMVTRANGRPEVVVTVDWADFERERYLGDAKVTVLEREPRIFRGTATGTRIEVKRLRQQWSRRMVRDLYRSIMSICSPFEGPGEFRPFVTVEPAEWLEGLKDPKEHMEAALYTATCVMVGSQLFYRYEFTPFPGMRLDSRVVVRRMPMMANISQGAEGGRIRVGPLRMMLRLFDTDPEVMNAGIGDKAGLKTFLKENGGIRVYRDGVRVYDYGEPGNDWLSLDARRVSKVAAHISNNIVVGAVHLKLNLSQDLVEKTNREGFVENDAYDAFRRAVLEAIQHIEVERNRDRERVKALYTKAKTNEPVIAELAKLKQALRKHEVYEELVPYVERVQEQFLRARDQLLTAAGAGLSMAVVIHEVEKAVAELSKAVERDVSVTRVRALAQHLSELIEGLAYVTRSNPSGKEWASKLIRHALFNTEYRLKYHNITLVNGLAEYQTPDFQLKCTRRLIIATIMNLIDNSIYWLDVKKGTDRRIYIGTTLDIGNRPAIVVADNGTGFVDPPEYLTQPFFTRKPDGMGLGLHLASMVMDAHDRGYVAFPEKHDLWLPKGFSGAVVALVFGGTSWTR